MKSTRSREWLPLAWAAVPASLPLLFGGALVHLNGLRGRVEQLEQELATKREAFTSLEVPAEDRTAVEARRAEADEWSEMTASDSLRVAELSRVASSAGVALRSLRSNGPQASGDGTLVACSHELTAIGTYRGLATFLDGIYAARGMARIDTLELQADETASADRLLATLRVTWAAQADPAPDAAQGDEAEGDAE